MNTLLIYQMALIFVLCAFSVPIIIFYGRLFFKAKITWKRMLLVFSSTLFARFITQAFFPSGIVGYVIRLSSYFFVCVYAFELRKAKLIVGFIFLLVILMLSDIVTMQVTMAMEGHNAFFDKPEGLSTPVIAPGSYLIVALITVGSQVSVLLLAWLFTRVFLFVRQRRVFAILLSLRPYIISAAVLTVAFASIPEAERDFFQLNIDNFSGLLRNHVFSLILVAVLTLYLAQDFRTSHLKRQNERMNHEKDVYDALLADTRSFRHNIANMIHGFEGKILSGNIEDISGYYKQMARMCACINNENAVALGRIPNDAVNALLLNKLKRSIDMEVPIFLEVEANLRWTGLRDIDMCRLLGALIDNAVEAAHLARSPHVSILMHRVESAMEIIIRNTFDLKNSDLTFLAGDSHSDKEGHDGLGLKTARELINTHKRAIMNQYRQGRYIETVLLFE